MTVGQRLGRVVWTPKLTGKPKPRCKSISPIARAAPSSWNGSGQGSGMTQGEEAAERVLDFNRKQQAEVPYTYEERAEVERLNREEADAVRRRYDGEEFNLHLLQQDIAKKRVAISRAATIRAMAQETDPKQRMWRTLVRFNGYDPEAEFLSAVVPGWDPRSTITFRADRLPDELRRSLAKDVRGNARVFARVNIGTEKATDLTFSDFEEAPLPDLDDLLT